MIIEMFSLKDKQKNPESIMVELTPETLAEEDSLRNAKVLHKNSLMVYWGVTLELTRVTGHIGIKTRRDQYLGFSGLKINLGLPKPDEPIRKM